MRPVTQADVEPWGLRGDRRWMAVDADGECVTAREERALLAITADTPATDPALSAALRLRARDHETIEPDVPEGQPRPVTVHRRSLEAVDGPAWASA